MSRPGWWSIAWGERRVNVPFHAGLPLKTYNGPRYVCRECRPPKKTSARIVRFPSRGAETTATRGRTNCER